MSVPRPTPLRPEELDWTPFAQEIVDNAQALLNLGFVMLASYDASTRTSRCVALGGVQSAPNQRSLRLMRRLLPAYDPLGAVTRIDANPYTRRLFDEGEMFNVPIADLLRHLVPPLVASVIGHAVGGRFAVGIPLYVEGRVLGALGGVQPETHFSETRLRTLQAFTRQAALSIHNRQLLEEQRRTHAALEASRRLVTQAEERTRRDVSEFLHSRVQSRLLVAEYCLGEVGDVGDEARARIEAVRAELEDLRENDVRQVSHQLHPEALRVGLIPALQVLASRLHGVLNVRIVVDPALVEEDAHSQSSFTQDMRLIAFRTVEEALGNVLKHAEATQATVALTSRDGALRLEVTDDGRGFDVAQQPPGLGLLCLGARMESAGGRWGIESRPGGPTRLWAEMPR